MNILKLVTALNEYNKEVETFRNRMYEAKNASDREFYHDNLKSSKDQRAGFIYALRVMGLEKEVENALKKLDA